MCATVITEESETIDHVFVLKVKVAMCFSTLQAYNSFVLIALTYN